MVFWTENIKLLDKIQEGDVVQINDVEVKQGFREDETHLNIRSSLEKLIPQNILIYLHIMIK